VTSRCRFSIGRKNFRVGLATPQIRELGTLGGNLCQRPRCWYFRCQEIVCLKKGGTVCHAQGGENRYHAILANTPCAIVHPSDTAPALMALGATVAIAGPRGSREIGLESFFVPPSTRLDSETSLEPGEIVEEVRVAERPAGSRSTYLKVREKESFDFALVSAAVAMTLKAGRVERVRIALGGVAPVPWRAREAEDALKGQAVTAAIAQDAGRRAVAGATPLAQNRYKVALAANVVTQAILSTA
jgi:xanthine dehydrogenase YagS FAD-binding subunit